MLVLTRKATEEIQIGASIKVTVLATSGNRVKLGISCPAGVPIRRAELPCKSAVGAASIGTAGKFTQVFLKSIPPCYG